MHPPGADDQSGELPEERWSPAQRVRTIVLSVISLLNEPNISSPADVEASVSYRKWKEGTSNEYIDRITTAIEKSKILAITDGVDIPTTVEEYCIMPEEEYVPTRFRRVPGRACHGAFALSHFPPDDALF